jgi:hypothetical protein
VGGRTPISDYVVRLNATTLQMAAGHGGSFAPIPDVPMNTFLQRSVRQQPAAVLRAFIADVCALKSLATYPREDGYCSVGSHERRLARDYFDRAYGMYLEDVEQ